MSARDVLAAIRGQLKSSGLPCCLKCASDRNRNSVRTDNEKPCAFCAAPTQWRATP